MADEAIVRRTRVVVQRLEYGSDILGISGGLEVAFIADDSGSYVVRPYEAEDADKEHHQ